MQILLKVIQNLITICKTYLIIYTYMLYMSSFFKQLMCILFAVIIEVNTK